MISVNRAGGLALGQNKEAVPYLENPGKNPIKCTPCASASQQKA